MTEIAVSRLNVARRLYASLSERAAAAYAIIRTLRAQELTVPCEVLVNEVATSVYYSASYDAYMRYSSLEEFEEALREDLDESLPGRKVNEVAHYVLRPYFNPSLEVELRGAKVNTLLQTFHGRKELEVLNVAVYVAPTATPIEGVLDAELRTLADDYHRRSLVIVNALRTLKTALASAATTMARLNPAELGMSAEVEAMLLRLGALVELPMLPPAARWFGTEADRINPLPELPAAFVTALVTS